MRKFGIIFCIIGVLQIISLIINLVKYNSLDNDLLIVSMTGLTIGAILFIIGKYRKAKAYKESKNYNEISWLRAILVVFVVFFNTALVGGLIYQIVKLNSIEAMAKEANKECPIPIADGTGMITSIAAKDNMIEYTITYNSDAVNLDKLKNSANKYKRVIVLSSYLLNGQDNNGDKFMKMVLNKHYGIAFKLQSPEGDSIVVSVKYNELKKLLAEAKKSPTDAMKEILEWQIIDSKSDLPTRIEEDMILEDILCDSTSLIYRVIVNKPLTISEIKDNNTATNRNEILEELYSDPLSKSNLDMCAVGNFNIVYRYINETNTDSCDIVFSHNEIYDIVQVPKSLNIN